MLKLGSTPCNVSLSKPQNARLARHFGGDIDLFGLIGSNAVPLGLRNDAVTVPYYRWLQLVTNDVVIP